MHQLPDPKNRFMSAAIGITASLITIGAALATEQAIQTNPIKKINAGVASVDPGIQKIAEKELSDAVQSHQAEGGFAIVADPASGRVLAIANIDKTQKYETAHWALSQEVSPGSVMKPLVAAAAMNDGLATPDSSFPCEKGTYRYGGHVYRDWKKEGWDRLTMKELVSVSSNICAIRMGEKVGASHLSKMMVDYGFGPQGVAEHFSEASTGTLPALDESKEPILVPEVFEGFGFSSTPLELVQIYGAIANSGNLMSPLPAQASAASAKVIRRVMSAESAQNVRTILQDVVEKGTGKRAQSDLYTTAGKTGSSYRGNTNPKANEDKKADFASFIGFAPASEPKIEIYVGIFKSGTQEGVTGGELAAPVFKEIAEKVLKQFNVAPDKHPKI